MAPIVDCQRCPTYFSTFQSSSSTIIQWHFGAHSSRKMMKLAA